MATEATDLGRRPVGLAQWCSERFELSRSVAGQNIRPMEGLRGLAVFLVFLVHYASLSEPYLKSGSLALSIAQSIHRLGNVGVDYFFVLSGYLIYGSLVSKAQPYARFLRRRVIRIYPAFLVVLSIYLLLSFLLPAESKLPAARLDKLAYVLANIALLPGIFPIEPILTVAWSLSYEFLFYIVLPILILLFRVREKAPAQRVRWILALWAVMFVGFCVFRGPVRLLNFLPGMLLYEWLRARPVSTKGDVWGWLALLGSLVLAVLPIRGLIWFPLSVNALGAGFMVACYFAISNASGLLSRVFSIMGVRWLGNMSYSYYLIHGLGLKAFFMVAGMLGVTAWLNPYSILALMPFVFLLTCVPAAILFITIERPYSLAK